MAKAKRGLSQLQGLGAPDRPRHSSRGTRAWNLVLKNADPEAYAAVVELIHDWLTGGLTAQHIPQKTQLLKFLQNKIDIPCEPPLVPGTVKYSAFCAFVKQVEEERGQSD